MNPVFIYALFFVFVPLGIYYLFALIIIYHLRKYSLDKAYARRTILVFAVGMIAIAFMITFQFTAVNWKRVNPERFLRDSAINIFYGNYERR
jgi:hypothetical protein